MRPWYQKTFRWAQTNITEIDPLVYDLEWWRDHWRRTHVQGVIINAGGIFSYYPSKLPFSHQAKFLGDRDLLGELVDAAREEGLAVIARMDSNRVHETLFAAHPDWIAVDQHQQPYRAGDLYITCIDGPYYAQYLPQVLKEIIEKYHPDGFTDNSYSGLDRNRISYSVYAAERFKLLTGLDLPVRVDWDDQVFREWVDASYRRRLEIWDLNNAITQKYGGEDCLWMGMVGGDFVRQGMVFRDLKEICSRSSLVMVDFQSRSEKGGFKQNSETGRLLHGLAGWDIPVIESMAQYAHGQPFRVSAAQGEEARLWMVSGFAGGILPWYHHIGSTHTDRRQYHLAEELLSWHEKNQKYLVNRIPIASVGVVWSQTNADYYGREDSYQNVTMPWQGITLALVRARIPYLPVHADFIEKQTAGIKLLILPDLAAMSGEQCQAVREFVERGGSVVASSATSSQDPWGQPLPDFALGDIFGVHRSGDVSHASPESNSRWEQWERHNYLCLHPNQQTDPGRSGEGSQHKIARHPVLTGFEETDLLPFGGRLTRIRVDPGADIPLTFGNPFPVYPPETAYTLAPDSSLPALVLRRSNYGGRIAYLAADIDRCYAQDHMPDHARLLENIIRWSVEGQLPIEVEGKGVLDCNLYWQENRLILHMVNLTGTAEYPLHELVTAGPFRVKVPAHVISQWFKEVDSQIRARLLVAEKEVALSEFVIETGAGEKGIEFIVPTISDHEVVVIE